MTGISEADWEQDALEALGEPLGWKPLRGEQIAPGSGERDTWDELLILDPPMGSVLRTAR